MKIKERINEKCNEIIREIEDKDPFGVSIDDCNSGDESIEGNRVIPPGDDGYGDEDNF